VGWRVPPLDLKSGLELFADRAALARPRFIPNETDTAAMSLICERLDGLPLAIELAAARTRMMRPQAIAAALEDRFRLLTGGSRTAQPRQQTLEASVAWSYELLDEVERTLLRRLSVFNTGFSLEAAEVVCSGPTLDSYQILDVLSRLVDKSLVFHQARREQPGRVGGRRGAAGAVTPLPLCDGWRSSAWTCLITSGR